MGSSQSQSQSKGRKKQWEGVDSAPKVPRHSEMDTLRGYQGQHRDRGLGDSNYTEQVYMEPRPGNMLLERQGQPEALQVDSVLKTTAIRIAVQGLPRTWEGQWGLQKDVMKSGPRGADRIFGRIFWTRRGQNRRVSGREAGVMAGETAGKRHRKQDLGSLPPTWWLSYVTSEPLEFSGCRMSLPVPGPHCCRVWTRQSNSNAKVSSYAAADGSISGKAESIDSTE